MTANGSSYARVVDIEGSSTDDMFSNVEFVGISTTSTSNSRAVVYSSSGTLNHRMTFENCGVRNGSYGLYLYGNSTSALEEDVVVRGCTFTGQYYRPLYSYYLGGFKFHENTVDFQSTYSGAYFAYTYNNADISVERNVFFSDGGGTRYGVYLGSTDGTDNRFVNNFVTIINNGSSTSRGLYLSSPANVLVAFNSIFINSTTTAGRCIYQTGGSNQMLYNNILYNDGSGYAIYASSPSAIVESDYNLFYSNGKDLAYWSGTRTTLTDLQTASGMDASSISKQVTFANAAAGDLHLAGASEDDTDLFGTMLKGVTEDIDNDLRVQPYRGADEACYITPGTVNYEFVDGAGMPAAFAEAPGSIGVHYSVAFPDFAATIEMTVRFLDPVTHQLAYTETITAQKAANSTLDGTQYITLPPTLASGAYLVEVNFWTKNSCGVYRDYVPYPTALLVVAEGRMPCVVWPGDANNDGVVNYADRRALNRYVYDANLRTSWLNGPARYQADAETNPFTYLEWKPQASAPWQTPDGCYMDTDGNGVVNNLDYIAMKLNWSATTPWFNGGAPRANHPAAANGFSMDQNYPNPFNPVTTIRYHAAEASQVRLAVTDALGREVAELENGRVEAGIHEVQFDASQLSSGTYVATITMTGIESGVTFLKTIKMALNK